jgi:hypothetical protein
MAVNSVLILVPLGIRIAYYPLDFRPGQELEFYGNQSIQNDMQDSLFLIPYFLAVILSLVLFIGYLGKLEVVPVFALFNVNKGYGM